MFRGTDLPLVKFWNVFSPLLFEAELVWDFQTDMQLRRKAKTLWFLLRPHTVFSLNTAQGPAVLELISRVWGSPEGPQHITSVKAPRRVMLSGILECVTYFQIHLPPATVCGSTVRPRCWPTSGPGGSRLYAWG